MKFDPSYCVHCGAVMLPFKSRWGLGLSGRPMDYATAPYHTDDTGVFERRPTKYAHLHFCSDRCFEKALAPFVNAQFLVNHGHFYKVAPPSALHGAEVTFDSYYEDDIRWKQMLLSDQLPDLSFKTIYEMEREIGRASR